jgi:hypothetical protein
MQTQQIVTNEKGTSMPKVVYAIECIENGFTYVGLSAQYQERWRHHRYELRTERHSVAKMLADWRKHGRAGFRVRVLEELPHDMEQRDAWAAELRWQAHFARLGRLYNERRCPMCGRPFESHESTIAEVPNPGPVAHTNAGAAGESPTSVPAGSYPISVS